MNFLDKLHLPLIESASELRMRLNHVQERKYKDYQYIAEPPCHSSSSRESFHFGDAPGGGISVGCWQCQRPGYLDDLESSLGVRIQVRNPNGSWRWRDGAPKEWKPVLVQAASHTASQHLRHTLLTAH